MTFKSVKVYLLEIRVPLLVQSHKTKKEKPGVYSLISDQLYVRTWFLPDWGHARIPSVTLCIIAFPFPRSHFCIIQDHRPYSWKVSSRCCLLTSKQTKLGGWTGGCCLYLSQQTQRVSCNVTHLFPVQSHFPRECNHQEIVRWGVCDGASLRLEYSGGKCDFS